MTRPNLFLMASPRSGSTQLAHWLNSHPDISLSAVKEPNHFSADEFDPNYVAASHLNDVDPSTYVRKRHQKPAQFAVFRNRADYEALFEQMRTPWRMEASTSYLSCPDAPALIHKYAPKARLIILTRNPLQRALSHYRLAFRTGRIQASLSETLKAELAGETPLAARFLLRPSQTAEGIKRIKALFTQEQCLFLEFEAMVQNPDAALCQVANWLDIDPARFDTSVEARNAGVLPRFARLNAILEKSGAKTALRRTLPAFAKPALKRLWLDRNRQIIIPASDVQALSAALETP
jgi:hypothetical protein